MAWIIAGGLCIHARIIAQAAGGKNDAADRRKQPDPALH